MARPSNFHKPTDAELRALLALFESATYPRILQRAEVIMGLCIAGIAREVAPIVNLHLITVWRYVRAFNHRR